MAKEGLKYGDDEEDEAEIASVMAKFQPLAIFLQAKLKDAVKKGECSLETQIQTILIPVLSQWSFQHA